MTYRIGTRGSTLALAQTAFVRARLEAAYPDDVFETVTIRTKGDVVTDRPIAAIGDNSLFTREIETALLEGRIDLAIHSMKDLAADCPAGLILAKAWTRADPRDVLVARAGIRSLEDLPSGATVATGSIRRDALLRRIRPDLRIVGLRGNVDTRLRKLFDPTPDEPHLDAIVLAAAGLKRLGKEDVITTYLDPQTMVPAPNQGQLAIELRAADGALKAKLDALGDETAELIVAAERAFLRETGADCHRPVGALAEIRDGRFTLTCVSGTTADDLVFERRTAGTVTLVGAGPGDPDLITVKGLKAIREADAIVYDRLIPEGLLKEAGPNCEYIYVGKASGCHTLPQDEINALLARAAVVHRRVVRLKGGDPFVFGRGGEEMAYLTARGIPCRVIPGVTSAIAAAASVGIPVTHRGVASGFEVITAHAQNGKSPEIDFSRCLDDRRTYVFLMGLARISDLAASLMAAGKDPSTPAAVVSAATTPKARSVVGTLFDIAGRVATDGGGEARSYTGEAASRRLSEVSPVLIQAPGTSLHRRAELASPAVLIVGATVALSRSLGLPLTGRHFLVPVIAGGTKELAARLRELGGSVDEVTVGRIVRIDGAFTERDLENVDRIVLTSRNGWLGLDERLRAAARARGICIEEVREVKPVGRTVHLTQPDAARVPGVVSVDVYRNEDVPVAGTVDLSRYDAALFTCASSVRRIFAAATGSTKALAIGRKTAAALEQAGAADIVVADRPLLDALIAAAIG